MCDNRRPAGAGYGGWVTPSPPASPGPDLPAPSPESPSPFSRLVRVPRTGSTNADVAHALRVPGAAPGGAREAWPHLSVLVTDHQAAGRGRAGRGWQTPPGTSLTATVVLRPEVPVASWSWLSLVGGLSVARAIARRTGLSVGLKWPNDVLLLGVGDRFVPGWGHDRKVAGVLAEIVRPLEVPVPSHLGEAPAVVLGFGVNVHQAPDQLPVPWATSLAAAGSRAADRDIPALLGAVGTELAALFAAWEAVDGDPEAGGVADAVASACVTLGRDVRILLPGGGEVTGRAVRLADDGALVVRQASGPEIIVSAGDVDHIRTLTG